MNRRTYCCHECDSELKRFAGMGHGTVIYVCQECGKSGGYDKMVMGKELESHLTCDCGCR